MEDRRVFARINIKLPVRFLDPSTGKEGMADTTDISANGLGLIVNQTVPATTPLEMWLGIPDQHEPLYTRGEVVWINPSDEVNKYRVGVQLERAELMGLARALWVSSNPGQALSPARRRTRRARLSALKILAQLAMVQLMTLPQFKMLLMLLLHKVVEHCFSLLAHIQLMQL